MRMPRDRDLQLFGNAPPVALVQGIIFEYLQRQGLAVQESLVQLVVDVAPFHRREVLSQHFETCLRVADVKQI